VIKDDMGEFDSDRLVDFMKFIAGIVDTATSQLGGIGPNNSPHATAVTVETSIAHLTTASHVLQHLVGVY
jgi:hypothetical protein